MESIVYYLPIAVVLLVVFVVELLYRRKISARAIQNYGKGTYHKQAHPTLYSSDYIIDQISSIRRIISGAIVIAVVVVSFIVLFYGLDPDIGAYSIIFTLLCVIALLILLMYGLLQIPKRKQATIVVQILLLLFIVSYVWVLCDTSLHVGNV